MTIAYLIMMAVVLWQLYTFLKPKEKRSTSYLDISKPIIINGNPGLRIEQTKEESEQLKKCIKKWTEKERLQEEAAERIKRNPFAPRSMTPMEMYFYSLKPDLQFWIDNYSWQGMVNMYVHRVNTERNEKTK